ncbi:MAG: SDR family oxidoreductase [Chitinophagaceae bacterium]|nr:SDR family oxidoreductase [Chitinophagaceae bacterium]
MSKILITGANGFLGQHLTIALSKTENEVVATSRGACRLPEGKYQYRSAELTNKTEVEQLINEVNPDIIIHTAALSKPDECNINRELCLNENVEATRNLITHSKAFFIYVSTDFIFGEDGPHAETALPAPLNFYGESKLMAEKVVEETNKPYAIVRPVFIYGKVWPGMRPGFLHWVKSNLEAGKRIKVVSDQQRTPTYVNDICKGIVSIINMKATGAFHLAGKDILSPYQMAVTTAEVLGLDTSLIENVTSETFPEPVKRAKRSGLLIERARTILGYEPVSFAEGVKASFE